MPANLLLRILFLKRQLKCANSAPLERRSSTPIEIDQKEREKELSSLLQEVLFYILFLALLHFFAAGCRDPRALIYKIETFKQLSGIDDVRDTKDVWEWLESTLYPFLYPDKDWYDTQIEDSSITQVNRTSFEEIQSPNVSLLVSGLASYRMGGIRLRQHRMPANACKETSTVARPGLLEEHGLRCQAPWAQLHRDWADYGPRWTAPVDNRSARASPWQYQLWRQIGGAPLYGEFGLYPPGGYVADLGVHGPRARATMELLRADRWMDELTRVMVTEVTLYTPNCNMFACVTAVFEYQQPHVVKAHLRFKAFTLMSWLHGYPLHRKLHDALVGLVMLWMGGRVIARLVKQRLKFFSSVWDILSLLNLLASLTVIVFYVGRHVIAVNMTATVKTMEIEDPSSLYNFQSLALWDEIFEYILAFVCFLAVLQFLPLLRYNRRIAMLALTLKVAWKDLPSFAIVFLVMMMAFCSFSYMMFGRQVYTYSSVQAALESLGLVVLGAFDYDQLSAVHRIAAPAFLFMYMLCVVFILVNMLVTILMDAFAVVRADDAKVLPNHELWDYFVAKIDSSRQKVNGLGCFSTTRSVHDAVNMSVCSSRRDNSMSVCSTRGDNSMSVCSSKIDRSMSVCSIKGDDPMFEFSNKGDTSLVSMWSAKGDISSYFTPDSRLTDESFLY